VSAASDLNSLSVSICGMLRTALIPQSSRGRDSLLPVLLEATDDYDVGGSRYLQAVAYRPRFGGDPWARTPQLVCTS
jgi:hypothetical protein